MKDARDIGYKGYKGNRGYGEMCIPILSDFSHPVIPLANISLYHFTYLLFTYSLIQYLRIHA